MKLSALLIFTCFVVQAETKNFNRAMRENIREVIKHNPEKYESNSPGRFPASATPLEMAPEEMPEGLEVEKEQMESLQRQGIGLPKW